MRDRVARVARPCARGARLVSRAPGAAARRLPVDIGFDELADPSSPDSHDWQQRTHATTGLSTPLALDAADRALAGGLRAGPTGLLLAGRLRAAGHGPEPGDRRALVPQHAGDRRRPDQHHHRVFDSDAVRTVIRGFNLLGAQVLAISRNC
jgi:hypothetical protein